MKTYGSFYRCFVYATPKRNVHYYDNSCFFYFIKNRNYECYSYCIIFLGNR